jgi:hypothetical protein
MPDNYLKLRGLYHIQDSQHTTQLENNLKMFFDWALLSAGAWIDVNINTTNAFGGDPSSLRKVNDPSFTSGRVWAGDRKDWIWETGISYVDKSNVMHSPIAISGVYVSGSFSSSSGSYPHYIDYPNGRVVFDTAINGPVQVARSQKYVQVYTANNAPWFQELQYGSLRIDDSTFTISASGQWNMLEKQRVQMPAVIIEVVPRREFEGYEQGNNSLWSRQDVLIHILAETKWDRDKLTDVFSVQQHKNIWLYDINSVLASGDYPLDQRGTLVNNTNYPDFVSPTGYRTQTAYILKSVTQDITSYNPKLFRGVVRWTIETIEGAHFTCNNCLTPESFDSGFM